MFLEHNTCSQAESGSCIKTSTDFFSTIVVDWLCQKRVDSRLDNREFYYTKYT